jgi:hypothetical protein
MTTLLRLFIIAVDAKWNNKTLINGNGVVDSCTISSNDVSNLNLGIVIHQEPGMLEQYILKRARM